MKNLIKFGNRNLQNTKFIYLDDVREGETGEGILTDTIESDELLHLEMNSYEIDINVENEIVYLNNVDITNKIIESNIKKNYIYDIDQFKFILEKENSGKIIFRLILKDSDNKFNNLFCSLPIQVKNGKITPEWDNKLLIQPDIDSEEYALFDDNGNIFRFHAEDKSKNVILNDGVKLPISSKNFTLPYRDLLNTPSLSDDKVLVFYKEADSMQASKAYIFNKNTGEKLKSMNIELNKQYEWYPENDIKLEIDKDQIKSINDVDLQKDSEIINHVILNKFNLVGLSPDKTELRVVNLNGKSSILYKIKDNKEQIVSIISNNGQILATTSDGKIIIGDKKIAKVDKNNVLDLNYVTTSKLSPSGENYIILGNKNKNTKLYINGKFKRNLPMNRYSISFINDKGFIIRSIDDSRSTEFVEFRGEIPNTTNSVSKAVKAFNEQVLSIADLLNNTDKSPEEIEEIIKNLEAQQTELDKLEKHRKTAKENFEKLEKTLLKSDKKHSDRINTLENLNTKLNERVETLVTTLEKILKKAQLKTSGFLGKKTHYKIPTSVFENAKKAIEEN